MLHRVQRLVAPPIFEGDEEKTYAARLLNTALLTLLAGTLLYSVLAPLVAAFLVRRLAIDGAMIGLLIGMLLALRRGHVRFAGRATVAGIWVLLTLTALISGGVRAPAFSGYIVVVLGAGILVGRRAAISVAVLSIAAGLAMVYAAQAGALPTSSAVQNDMSFWAAHATYLVVAAVFLSLAIRSIHTALERAHRELAERKQAEAALRASEERYRQISELVSDYAFAYRTSADGTAVLEWVTDAMTRITGFTAEEMATSEAWDAVTHPDDRSIALRRRQRLQTGQSDVSEYRILAKDGQIRWLRFYSRPVREALEGQVLRVYGAVQDITAIKHLEQQLSQAQKLEAVGRLAGGVAHDFNNMLTVILGSCTLVLDHLDHEHALRYDIEQIQAAARRATALTRQLLAFSSRQVLQPTILDLNEVVISTTQLLRRLIGEDIQLVTRLAPGLGMVKADAGQLDQVLVNLAVNARDAMPHGGALTIETANVDLDEAGAREHADVAAGPYIMLAISDTGYGMDAATTARIFEPFFTTKAPGKGPGLGLAIVHGIVRQSDGYIQVLSEPGRGTSFKVHLPRVTEVAAQGADPQRDDRRALGAPTPHSPYERAGESSPPP
ncbi:MAG: two-component system sensor histidine kinase NtrB [Roseiflexaceae bacterium]